MYVHAHSHTCVHTTLQGEVSVEKETLAKGLWIDLVKMKKHLSLRASVNCQIAHHYRGTLLAQKGLEFSM